MPMKGREMGAREGGTMMPGNTQLTMADLLHLMLPPTEDKTESVTT